MILGIFRLIFAETKARLDIGILELTAFKLKLASKIYY
jgi:hypothetical protein